jgi:hypothetical protein
MGSDLTVVDFRKALRFPRGDLEPPRAAPCGVSTLSLLPRWSLRPVLQSTTRVLTGQLFM